MLKNYFTIAFRSLLRHKAFSFINIMGFSVVGNDRMLPDIFIRSFWKNRAMIILIQKQTAFTELLPM